MPADCCGLLSFFAAAVVLYICMSVCVLFGHKNRNEPTENMSNCASKYSTLAAHQTRPDGQSLIRICGNSRLLGDILAQRRLKIS